MSHMIALTIAIMAASVAGGGHVDQGPEVANDAFSQEQLKRLLRTKIETVQEIASNSAIIRAVRKQNAESQSPATIKQLDSEWTGSKKSAPFKKSLQENLVGEYFKSLIDFNDSIYNEAFLTDRNGANIAAYPATTDYWQGDEKKWTAAFNEGQGGVKRNNPFQLI